MKKLMIASAVAIACTGVQAQFSGELGYAPTTITIKDSGDKIKTKPSAIRGLLGYELHPNLAVEGMLAFGLSDSDVSLNGRTVPTVNIKIDSVTGIYLKPKMKLSDAFEVFARLGFADMKIKASAPRYSESGSESGSSYGAGLSYAITSNYSVSADYMNYIDKNGGKADGWTVGLRFKF
jgi:opacity protein-like surface antigen